MATQLSHHADSDFAANTPAAEGATGARSLFTPAGRATPILDRRHWGFDPVAYRQAWLMQALSPAMGATVAWSMLALVIYLLVAVGAGF